MIKMVKKKKIKRDKIYKDEAGLSRMLVEDKFDGKSRVFNKKKHGYVWSVFNKKDLKKSLDMEKKANYNPKYSRGIFKNKRVYRIWIR